MTTRTTLASAAISALLLTTATACGSTYGSGGSMGGGGGSAGGGGVVGGGGALTGGQNAPSDAGNNSCEFRFDPVTTGIATGASIKGSVITKCAVAPQRHTLNLYLQRLVNSVWTDQNSKVINTIPNAVFTPNLITAPCVPGSWRVVVSIDGVSATGISWSVDDTASHPQEVSPHDCD